MRSRAKRGNQSKVGSIRRSATFFVTLADPDPGFSLRNDGRKDRSLHRGSISCAVGRLAFQEFAIDRVTNEI